MKRAPHALPAISTHIPGPRSTALAERLARVESRNITSLRPMPPIFWSEAWNANVADADDNVFIDLTSGFGVAFAGHSNPAVTAAIAAQARTLAHAMGDVYPPRVKVELLEKLAEIAPGNLSVSILGSDGADAVEAALKTALLKTGRPGILAFEGSYHGLTAGALAATWRDDFRRPFLAQLNPHVRFAPFPHGLPDPVAGSLQRSLDAVAEHVEKAERTAAPIGAIIVEPMLGRGGFVMPPDGFLQALRELCDGQNRVLIYDEIFTGIGRSGHWFMTDHFGVVPDILTVGKALTGSIPLSAAIGSPDVMMAWPASTGEAIHTSTFLGNPVACAAALAQLRAIEEMGYLSRAISLGSRIAARAELWVTNGLAVGRRGTGLLQAVRLPSTRDGIHLTATALQRGILVLPEGDGSIVGVNPPACITDEQLDYALDVLEVLLHSGAANGS